MQRWPSALVLGAGCLFGFFDLALAELESPIDDDGVCSEELSLLQSSRSAKPAPRSTAAASTREAAALARALPSGSPPLVALGAASRSNAASRGEARAPAHRGPLAVLSSSSSLVALDIADRSAARSRGEAVLAEHNFVSSDLELPPEDRAMTMLRFIDLSGRHSSRGVRLATLLWITVPLVFITVIYC